MAALRFPGHRASPRGAYPMSSNVSPSPRMSPPRARFSPASHAICSLFLFRLSSSSRARVAVFPTLPCACQFSTTCSSIVKAPPPLLITTLTTPISVAASVAVIPTPGRGFSLAVCRGCLRLFSAHWATLGDARFGARADGGLFSRCEVSESTFVGVSESTFVGGR